MEYRKFSKFEKPVSLFGIGCMRLPTVKKGDEIIGVEAKHGGPGRPLCLTGRLGLDLIYNPSPTAKPLIKKNGKYVPVDWEEALRIRAIINKLNQMEAAE